MRGKRITGGWRPSPPLAPPLQGEEGTTGAFAGVMCGGRERMWGLVHVERITGGWRWLPPLPWGDEKRAVLADFELRDSGEFCCATV